MKKIFLGTIALGMMALMFSCASTRVVLLPDNIDELVGTLGAATSGDANYAGVDLSDVTVTNSDNDVAGITVTPTGGLVTTEAAGTTTFTVVLNTQPTADVTIGVSSSDTSEGTVNPSSLTFTVANWSTAQTVTVTGQDDDEEDGDKAYTIVLGSATSGDANYAGVNPADVAVTNSDDESPLFGVSYRGMISVPGGTYTQTDTSGNSFLHTISAFQMAKYEVTYELWYTVRNWAVSNGYSFASAGREGSAGSTGSAPSGAKYEPVTTINWRDAMVWSNAYSEKSGLTPSYTYGGSTIKDSRDSNAAACDGAVCNWAAGGFRLPSEGEWQYAASYIDGTSWTPYNYASGSAADYSNGGAAALVAWYNSNSGSKTQEVGTKTANQIAIHDMSGNVWEWCWDWYGAYPGTQSDYHGASGGSGRVFRGGSWYNYAYYLRVGHRYNFGPNSEHYSIGFRLARTQ